MELINKELNVKNSVKFESNDTATYPKCRVGAGLDYNVIFGSILCGDKGSIWGLKISYFWGGKWVDGANIRLKDVVLGCNQKNGEYAYFKSGNIVCDFVKYADNAIVIKISSTKKVKIRAVSYSLTDPKVKFQFDNEKVKGIGRAFRVNAGELKFNKRENLFINRYGVLEDEKEYYYANSYTKPSRCFINNERQAVIEYVITDDAPFMMYLCVGDENVYNSKMPKKSDVIDRINTNQLNHFSNKSKGGGILGEKAEALANLCMWNKVYYPYNKRNMYLSSRYRVNEDYTLDPFEDALAILINSYINQNDFASEIELMSASNEDFAIFIAYNLYLRNRDKEMLEKVYDKMISKEKFDGEIVKIPRNSLGFMDSVICGTEYKTDKKTSSKMYSLHKSCLKAFTIEILSKVANILDRVEDANKFNALYSEIKDNINETFWNENKKAYYNVGDDGRFVSVLGINSFFPLIAGVVDTEEKLASITNILKDSKMFGSDKVIKMVSKNSILENKKKLKKDKIKYNKSKFKYPATITPYANYLIYLGLVRYNLNDLASSLAKNLAKLFNFYYRYRRESSIFYTLSLLFMFKKPDTENRFSLSGSLLSLAGMQSLLDVEYFGDSDKLRLRFGTFTRGDNSIYNIKIDGSQYSVASKDMSTTLIKDDVHIFRGEGGKFIVRNFDMDGGECEFDIYCKANIQITLNITNDLRDKISFIVKKGNHKIKINTNKEILIESL